jgi:hypothetical protein
MESIALYWQPLLSSLKQFEKTDVNSTQEKTDFGYKSPMLYVSLFRNVSVGVCFVNKVNKILHILEKLR